MTTLVTTLGRVLSDIPLQNLEKQRHLRGVKWGIFYNALASLHTRVGTCPSGPPKMMIGVIVIVNTSIYCCSVKTSMLFITKRSTEVKSCVG